MTEFHCSNLARTALVLLASTKEDKDACNPTLSLTGREKVTFDMGILYASASTPHLFAKYTADGLHSNCGFSCCFAGLLALVAKDTRPDEFWSDYLYRQTGFHGDATLLGQFLFAAPWPSEPGQAARRTALALSDPTFEIPEYIEFTARYLEDWDDARVIATLQTFIRP